MIAYFIALVVTVKQNNAHKMLGLVSDTCKVLKGQLPPPPASSFLTVPPFICL